MENSTRTRRGGFSSLAIALALLLILTLAVFGDTGPSEPPIAIPPHSLSSGGDTTAVDSINVEPSSGSEFGLWGWVDILLSTLW